MQATPPDRILFRFERSLELGRGEATLLGQLCFELGYPREDSDLGGYLAQAEHGAGLLDHYPELATFRDIVFYLKAMMVPSSDALPELRAWAPEDAKLQWSWKREERSLGVRAFGGPLTCAAWMSGDDDGGNATAKPGFFTRLLGKKASPRLPPSAANASTLAGQDIATEDDVLHVRHLPDFGGTLRAADSELLLTYLLAPYLRVPLLMRFFAEPAHTQALAQAELQDVLDAALFEPGGWQPDAPKPMPETVPAPDRACLATPCGLLFQAPTCARCTRTCMHTWHACTHARAQTCTCTCTCTCHM